MNLQVESLQPFFNPLTQWKWKLRYIGYEQVALFILIPYQIGYVMVCLKMGYTPNYSHLVGIRIINHCLSFRPPEHSTFSLSRSSDEGFATKRLVAHGGQSGAGSLVVEQLTKRTVEEFGV